MGTRSITHIQEKDEFTGKVTTITTIYRQYDGDPSGMGRDIRNILGNRKLVQGYNDSLAQMNGPSCAAALLVSQLKGNEAGNIYIVPPETEKVGEEFTYTVHFDMQEMEVHLRVEGEGGSIWSGPLKDFDPEKM